MPNLNRIKKSHASELMLKISEDGILFSCVLLLQVLLASGSVAADEINIKECIKLGLENNFTVAAAQKRVEAAKRKVDKIKLSILPNLSASFYGATTHDNKYQIATSLVKLEQPIYDGGRYSAELEKAQGDLKGAEKDLEKAKFRLGLEIKKSYVGTAIYYELQVIYRQAYADLADHCQKLKRMYEKGEISKLEVLKGETILLELKQYLTQYQREYDSCKVAFNRLLHRDFNAEMKLEPLVLSPPTAAASRSEWIRIGLKNNPELAEMDEVVRQNEYAIKMIESQYQPQLSVSASFNQQKDIYIDTSRYLLAAEANWKVWDWGAGSNEIEAEKLEVSATEYEQAGRREELIALLAKSYGQYNYYQRELDIARELMDKSQEILAMQKKKFADGTAANDEIPQAYLAAVFSQSRYFLLESAFRTFQANSEYTLGVNNFYEVESRNLELKDDELLEVLERKSFDYFMENQSQDTGLFADYPGGDASIAVTGFGLTALCIGAERGWIKKEEAKTRVLKCLKTFSQNEKGKRKAENHNGFFYHYLDMATGERAGNSEVSTVDTALLLCGILTAGEYFDGEAKELSKQIYHEVDWMSFYDENRNLFNMGWTPETGYSRYYWDAYTDEVMIITLLAIGADMHPVPAEAFYAWKRSVMEGEHGKKFICSWQGALFTYQYSHAWLDFRGKKDRDNINWWNNSVEATQAGIQFCRNRSQIFKDGYWGISSYDTPKGYVMDQGFSPCMSEKPVFDGTLSPSGVAGSIAFAPNATIEILKRYYKELPKLWGQYGFASSFNSQNEWYSEKYYGLDQGITLLMLENFRTELVWKTFMKNENVKKAFQQIQMTSDGTQKK